ncbi:MAG: hypothetical protein ABFS32_05850 [Bacteroidota bacterium]
MQNILLAIIILLAVSHGKCQVTELKSENARLKAEIEQLKLQLEEQRKIAQEAQALALNNSEFAKRQKYLASASALALKATGNFLDPQLKGLLAIQAYKFNKKHEGPVFNTEVFAGIYSALSYENGGFDDITTQSLQGHNQQVSAITKGSGFSIYSGDSNGKILHWKIEKGVVSADTIMRKQKGEHHIKDMLLSPDERYLLSVGSFRDSKRKRDYLEVIDLHNNNQVTKITGFLGVIKDIEVLESQSRYFVLSEKGMNVQEVDIQTGTISDFIKPEVKINDLAISADGRYLAGAGANGNVFVWDLNNGNSQVPHPANRSVENTALLFSPDGRYLVVGELSGIIHLFNTETNQRVRTITDFQQKVTGIKFSPDGQYLAVSSLASQIRVWNMKNLSARPYVMNLYGWATSMSFSSDSRFLFGGGADAGEIRVWPMNIDVMANKLCGLITRGFTKEEWVFYVDEISEDYPYDGETCNLK